MPTISSPTDISNNNNNDINNNNMDTSITAIDESKTTDDINQITDSNTFSQDMLFGKLASEDHLESVPMNTSTSLDKIGFRSKRRRSSAISLPGSNTSTTTTTVSSSSSSTITSTTTSNNNNFASTDLRKKKKKKKDNKKFDLNVSDVKNLSIRDIRDLTLFLYNNTNNSPRWCNVQNRSSVKKVLIFFIPGLQTIDYELLGKTSNSNSFSLQSKLLYEDNLKFFNENDNINDNHFNLPVCAPGSKYSIFSAYNAFINVNLSKKEKDDKFLSLTKNKKKITINDLLINVNDMIENDYPIHLDSPNITIEQKKIISNINNKDNENWVDTINFDHDGSHIFSLDCEMCKSDSGLVLTRISLIDFNNDIILDTFVKPDVPIIDYLTQYSGITKEKLENVTTTIKDVQEKLLKIISSNDILIGHSLQSDLTVLKLRHPKIVDTALSFDHKAGPPFKPSLKNLAKEFLNKNIQEFNNNILGHDSIEDAITCLELIKLKILNGLAFGCQFNTENLFFRLSQKGIRSLTLNDNNSKLSHISNIRNFGHRELINSKGCEESIKCKSDDNIFEEILKNLNSYDLFVSRLRGLEFARNYAKPKKIDTNYNLEIPTIDSALNSLKIGIENIYEKTPNNSIIILLSGSGDTRNWMNIMQDLNKLDKNEKENAKIDRNKEIQEAISMARDGVVSVFIKS